MTTIGYLFVLVGMFTIRAATKGRHINDVPGDLGAILIALVSGDTAAMTAVLARTGNANDEVTVTPSDASGASQTTLTVAGSGSGGRVLAAAQQLAQAAGNRYQWGGTTAATGYDCSGLVWAACKQAGVYTGGRFTSGSAVASLGSRIAPVTDPQVGDLIIWPTHIGIIDGPGTMFSALNTHDGILHSPITYGPKGESYKVYRFVDSAAKPSPSTVSI